MDKTATIERTTKHTQSVTVPIPYYAHDVYTGEYYAIIADTTVGGLKVYTAHNCEAVISICANQMPETAIQICQAEFVKVFNAALNAIDARLSESLQPA